MNITGALRVERLPHASPYPRLPRHHRRGRRRRRILGARARPRPVGPRAGADSRGRWPRSGAPSSSRGRRPTGSPWCATATPTASRPRSSPRTSSSPRASCATSSCGSRTARPAARAPAAPVVLDQQECMYRPRVARPRSPARSSSRATATARSDNVHGTLNGKSALEQAARREGGRPLEAARQGRRRHRHRLRRPPVDARLRHRAGPPLLRRHRRRRQLRAQGPAPRHVHARGVAPQARRAVDHREDRHRPQGQRLRAPRVQATSARRLGGAGSTRRSRCPRIWLGCTCRKGSDRRLQALLDKQDGGDAPLHDDKRRRKGSSS